MRNSSNGNTLGEYSVIIGLIVVTVWAALNLLGGNMDLVFSNHSKELGSSPMQNYVAMQFNASNTSPVSQVAATASSHEAAINHSPLGLIHGSSGGVNASSTDGGTLMATAHAATTIERLSAQISDPETQVITNELATFLYGMTLSEGFLGDVPGFSKSVITGKDDGYTSVNALRDIYNGVQYSEARLKKLASGPLANDPTVQEVIRLADTAIQKAYQDYPIADIRQKGLNQNQNASFDYLNKTYFKGIVGYNTQQSTINDLTLSGGNPLPDLAKSTVRSALENRVLDPHVTVKSGAVAAVSSDDATSQILK